MAAMMALLGLAFLCSNPAFRDRSLQPGGPGVERLEIGVCQMLPMTDAELDTIRDQITRIWRQHGIVPHFTGCPEGPRQLTLVLTSASIRVTPTTRNLCDLGTTRFVDGIPQPNLTVSVTAAREFVRQARPEWAPAIRTLVAARIAGRAAAHELGHYLLAESGHRARGLMRARFDGADLLGPHLGAFVPPQRVDVEAGLVRAMTAAPR